jgi:hypothetical protein
MKGLFCSRDNTSKGAALMIVLAFVVLLTGIALAYFSRTTTDRQLAQSSYTDTSSDLLARSALDIIVRSLKQELLTASTSVTQANIQPQRSGDDASIPNLIRRSVYPDLLNGNPGVASQASNVSSGPVNPSNPRRGEVTFTRWNSHYLIPSNANFSAPAWVLVTRNGPAIETGIGTGATALNNPVSTNANYVVGRYAFAVYDEGGLLDMNLAGYPAWGGTVNANPAPSPTPWQVNVGRKGIVAFADLTALPGAPTTAQIDKIVGARNYATTEQNTTSGSWNFSTGNTRNPQDDWGTYLLDFGDAPYTNPSIYPFTLVPLPSDFISNNRTDQASISRQDLIKRQRSIAGLSQDVLQGMGTFSRDRNRPSPGWNLGSRLTDRFPINALGLIKANPPGSVTPRGRGKGNGNGGKAGFRGRGRYRGLARDILDMFGLAWVSGVDSLNGVATTPYQLEYWGHWVYVGEQAPTEPNSNALPHIPPLRGRLEFIKILNYCLNQANPGYVFTENDTNLAHVARTLGITASMIDQYDDSGDVNEPDPKTGSHTTIIQYSGGFVLGWENEDNPSNPSSLGGYDVNKDPYAWITNDGTPTGTKKPRPSTLPSTAPIVLNHALSSVGEFGYGLDTENGFQPLNFTTETSNDKPVLDFFTYNPILSGLNNDGGAPRAGIVNLNTRNVGVLAAVLKSTLKNETIVPPPSSGIISDTEAQAAAGRIVAETTARPVLNRADVARLVRVGADSTWTKEQKEALARALAEMGQTRTWNLMVDVIAQTGRYTSGAQALTDFTVEGEKRYWLHIALGRDLVSGQVDLLGAQLEQVVD